MFAGIEFAEQNPRRKWTALVSFTAQVSAIATILVLPLFHPQSLPEALMHSRIFVPTTLGDVRVVEASHNTTVGHSAVAGPMQPIVVARDNGVHLWSLKPAVSGPLVDVPSLGPGPSGPSVVNSIVNDHPPMVPPTPPPVTQRPYPG